VCSLGALIYAAFVLPLCGLLALIIRRVQQPDNGYGPGDRTGVILDDQKLAA
jgi:hypothetical protein